MCTNIHIVPLLNQNMETCDTKHVKSQVKRESFSGICQCCLSSGSNLRNMLQIFFDNDKNQSYSDMLCYSFAIEVRIVFFYLCHNNIIFDCNEIGFPLWPPFFFVRKQQVNTFCTNNFITLQLFQIMECGDSVYLICAKCILKLRDSYVFRHQVEDSQRKLKQNKNRMFDEFYYSGIFNKYFSPGSFYSKFSPGIL